MAKDKEKTVFLCGECGYESPRWMGKCPACGSWNTLVEETTVSVRLPQQRGSIQRLSDVSVMNAARVSTGMSELDRVTGGGLLAGMVVLLGGDPGIGKSTLLMQAADCLAGKGSVLYVSGEESAAQLKLRADRLRVQNDMLLLCDTSLEHALEQAKAQKSDYLIIDSIQTMSCEESQSAPGSVSQVRAATAMLTRYAKESGTAVLIVGHVTKDGAIAGPRVLEHIVDTVLYFEGDRHAGLRLLRAVKNRFGSTNEIGVFEMCDTGMRQVVDPSRLFLSGANAVGCVRLEERGADLAVALCIASALGEKPLPPHTAVIGELGLTGELRGVAQMETRLHECARLGYTHVLIPKAASVPRIDGLTLVPVSTISEAIDTVRYCP